MIKDNFASQEQRIQDPSKFVYKRALFDVHARIWMAGVLIVTDISCLLISLMIALQVRWLSVKDMTGAYEQIYVLLALILVQKFYRTGLYECVGLHYIDELNKIFTGIASTFAIVLVVIFLLQTSIIYSRLVILLAWVLSIVIIPLGRYLVRRCFINLGQWGVPVMIVGNIEKAQSLAEDLRINLHHGLRPCLLVCDEFCLSNSLEKYPVFSLESIKEISRQQKLEDALILVDDLNNLDFMVDRYRFIFKRIILIKDQAGKYGLHYLKPLDFASTLGLQVNNNLLSTRAQFLKKLIDVVGSFAGILLTAPFFALAALLIKLDSPGRVFYRQLRVGSQGKIFYLLKFRTMHQDADKILAQKFLENPALKQEWDCYQKLKKDPRVTRIGHFLRKFSLDEFPQLINIVRGEMSLVGPRPILMEQREIYGSTYKDYIQVTPGLTGLWQVSGRNGTSFTRRAELDNEYIQRWSIWMDIYILLKTVKVVLWSDGAY